MSTDLPLLFFFGFLYRGTHYIPLLVQKVSSNSISRHRLHTGCIYSEQNGMCVYLLILHMSGVCDIGSGQEVWFYGATDFKALITYLGRA